jgi:hypothetical protein
MNLQAKRLLGGRKQLCLVISLGNGIRVQHPVLDESEAIEIYSHYSKLHPHLGEKKELESNAKPVVLCAAV